MIDIKNFKWDQLRVGLSDSFEKKITKKNVDYFLENFEDSNPLHTSEEYATRMGFNGKVVYGMLTASLYSTLVGVYLPGKWAILQEINIQFNRPVYVDDQLLVSGEIKELHDTFKQILIIAQIKNHRNERVSKAWIKVGLIER